MLGLTQGPGRAEVDQLQRDCTSGPLPRRCEVNVSGERSYGKPLVGQGLQATPRLFQASTYLAKEIGGGKGHSTCC